MDKVLITGASGQLGTELRYLLNSRGVDYLAPRSTELDITNSNQVDAYIEKHAPTFVFHCAAYTAVDKAEEEGKTTNWEVNAIGTENVAIASQAVGAVLVYVSTDYVFDGESTAEYGIDDKVNPQNEYGKAKYAGEQAVQKYCNKYYIIRTSWVFGEFGSNFVYTMLRLADTHDQLTVVADQVGRPTWTKTLAEFMYFIFQNQPEYGIYHLSNNDSCSWYEFACEILKDKKIKIQPVTSEEYPQKAYRPKHSVMCLEKTKQLGFRIPTWKEALSEFLRTIEV